MTETRERLEETVTDGGPVAKTVTTAVVAAAFAGLASAAKTLLERRRDAGGEDEPEEPEAEAEEQEPEAEAEEQEPEAEAEDEEPEAEAEAQEPEAEADDEEDEEDEEPEPEPDADADGERGSRPDGSPAEVVEAARHELEELLGHEVESVSSFERADEGWRVTLEVVDLRRIPDSSDVLSSYEVVIGDDGQLVSLDRSRRYRRAQVDPE